VEDVVPFTSRTPTYLTPEQCHALIQIPADLSDREIARHYTFSRDDLDLINQRRRHHNRLGFAVQLAVLRFPGRPWKDLAGIPSRVLLAIADQVQVPASAFALYGKRDNTLYEHLDEIRRTYKFRECGWREYLWLARELLPLAMESDRPIPLIEQALELLRTKDIIAPVLTHLERLVWIVLKAAEKCLFRVLTATLTLEHRSRLDGLLHADAGRRGTARLIWLREPPGVTSAKSVKQIVERLLFLRGLGLPALPPTLHQNRVLQLARKCSKYQTQPLLKFKAERRHALLMAHLFELSQDLTDQALDQFDRLLGELMRKGERRQEKLFRLNARTLNSHLAVLTKATEAFLVARTEGEDPVTAVLAKVSETQLQATVDSAKRLLRPENLDSLDLIESRYIPMRQSLLSLYQALNFQPVRKSEPALQALEYVSQLAERRKRVTAREQKVGKVKMTAPLGHLTERWRKHALNGDEIAPNYYEAAAFEALKVRVRSGDIAVDGSRRHRAFEGYLLPAPHFEQLAQKDQTRLAVTEKAEVYLAAKQQEIIGKLEALQESIGKVEGSLCLDDKGKLHLPALEKEIPAEVERLRLRVYDMLPQITLPDLLLELDNWTGFLRPLTHLTSGDAPVGDEKLVIVAALMGMGMNLGLTKMEQSCPYTYRQLSWSVDWHIREETLLSSQACLDNFVLSAPLSHAWGDGTTSSSDGMRMSVGVKAANAEYNAKYFGVGRGTNIYVHAADIWMPFGKPQVIGTNEEALYVIDALCHHESDLHIREHYTDTGGSTEQVFALATLLGFRFAPRISDALAKKLYVLDAVEPSEPLKTLLFEPVNKKLIMDQWEEMQRVASSIRHGTVSASLLMRKLAAYPRQNQVARALTEFGKLERTTFLLEYFRDEALRRRILIGLNKGEALHALARQLFFGRLGELRDRALEDQIHRASCLHLLIAAIAAWNTIYLTEAFATLRRQGEDISETTIAHIAPLGWEHINLIGKYQFAPQPGRSLENLRPLRLKVRTEGEKIPQEVVG
jgi:TnpA family transposase